MKFEGSFNAPKTCHFMPALSDFVVFACETDMNSVILGEEHVPPLLVPDKHTS